MKAKHRAKNHNHRNREATQVGSRRQASRALGHRTQEGMAGGEPISQWPPASH